MRRRLAAALASAAWLICGACAPPSPPSVLLVTFDTTRHDAVGFAGNEAATTPHLDALAARGLVFERAYASAGITLPSHTTLLTGLEPHAHGVRDNGRFALPPEPVTLAERLTGAGWESAAFVSAWVLAPAFGLDQGFSRYGAEVRATSSHPLDLGVAQRPGEEVTDAALSWLAGRERELPFFLWVHYYDPHLPRTESALATEDPYLAEVEHADSELGRLLAGIDSLHPGRELLVAFTSDHGESFGAHGEATHALLAYDSTLHVPLLLAGPGIPRGARSTAFARHVDLVPTLLARLGLPEPSGLPGRDLVAAAAAPEASPSPIGWFESRSPSLSLGWAPLDGVRDARWKLTARPAPVELYDVRTDPNERHNVAAEHPEVVERLGRLHAERLAAETAATSRARRTDVPDETRERLATLGYVEAAGQWAIGQEPDPRRWARAHALVDVARGAAQQGRFDQAIATLEAMRHSSALRPLVLRTLAPLYRERGRFGEAAQAYIEYERLTGASEARWGLAETYLAEGRPDRVLGLFPTAAGEDRAVALRARALSALGRHADADRELDDHFGTRLDGLRLRALLVLDTAPRAGDEEALRLLLRGAPNDPELLAMLGYWLAVWGDEGRTVEATRILRAARSEAVRSDSVGSDSTGSAAVLSHVGWGLHKLGLSAEALAALEQAVAADPGRHLDRVRLGILLSEARQPSRARALLEESVIARPAAAWAPAARRALAALDAERERGEAG
ncbi:MAG: sulfatase-like hydrolase/transferase [Myxococcales bacterium]|nr:sulfatase-like hydrolase/transferase [Myxococcales bacterium]